MDYIAKVATTTPVTLSTAAVGMTIDGEQIGPGDFVLLLGNSGLFEMQGTGALKQVPSVDAALNVRVLLGSNRGKSFSFDPVAGKFTEISDTAAAGGGSGDFQVQYVAPGIVTDLTDNSQFYPQGGGSDPSDGATFLLPYSGTGAKLGCYYFDLTSATLVAMPQFAVIQGQKIQVLDGFSEWVQTAATGAAAPTFQRSGDVVLATSDPTPLTAGGETAVVTSVTVPENTLLHLRVDWECYDGGGNVVSGSQFVSAIRYTGNATQLINKVGADFVDNTGERASPWNPTVALSTNDVEVSITPDASNDLVPRVSIVQLKAQSISDAPAAVTIETLRAALHAMSPTIELYSDVGRTPTDSTPGTVLTALDDQSGNSHNASVVNHSTANITYTPDGSGNPAILCTAASSACDQIVPSGTFTSAQNHLFCWEMDVNAVAGTAIKQLYCTATNKYITIDWTTGANEGISYSNGTTLYVLGQFLSGRNRYAVEINNTAHTATLYINGVAETPKSITADLNAMTIYTVFGSTGSGALPPDGMILGASVSWHDTSPIADVAAKVAAFDAFAQVAYEAA